MICTRCDGTGYLNGDQDAFEAGLDDVTVCDCCGDGDGEWYGEPGHHFDGGDERGSNGPYAYNGGLPECN